MKKTNLTYEKSGVNIKAADKFINYISSSLKKTKNSVNFKNIGGFGAVTKIPKGLKTPYLVTCTDGVGTKLEIANKINNFSTIGIDLVAMSVNDLIVQGAKPILFLDYISIDKINLPKMKSIMKGIIKGCKIAKCELAGGETAEMPGTYSKGKFDLAGFSVGLVEEKRILLRSNIKEGDLILGIPSSGIHSNGYSLVRKIVDECGLSYFEPAPFNTNVSLGDALLEPTIIYVNAVKIAREVGNIKGIAHITGGGLLENLPRILPDGKCAALNLSSWPKSPVFTWLIETGSIEVPEMLRTFNCGIGMVIIVSADEASAISNAIEASGQPATPIGVIEHLKKREPVLFHGDWA